MDSERVVSKSRGSRLVGCRDATLVQAALDGLLPYVKGRYGSRDTIMFRIGDLERFRQRRVAAKAAA